MTVKTPVEALVGSSVRRAPHAGSADHARLLDEAYLDYCRRCESGERVDMAAFCASYGAMAPSVMRLLMAHEYLEARPELLAETPANWPEVGTPWEGFDLLEELGRGSFARVYLAREMALGQRLVAIKVTLSGYAEADLLGRLDHPNVVPIHSIRELVDGNLTVVCMPYLGHATLDKIYARAHDRPQPVGGTAALWETCRDPRLPGMKPAASLRRGAYLDCVIRIASRIASALAYLHERGISHRDLKPSNILLQPDGTPRLLDFNLSADVLRPQQLVGGTLWYMAPELLQALPRNDDTGLTPQIDVFSLGVILCEWLTGVHPFAPLPADENFKALGPHLIQRYQAGPPDLRALAKVDRTLANLIERCLAYRPEQRPSAVAVEQALRRLLRWPRRLARWAPRHPYRTACAAVLLSATLALGAYHVAVQPPRAQVAQQQGWLAYRNGDYRQALVHFDHALQQDGADAGACLFAKARACQRLGDADKDFFSLAITEYKQAHERAPRSECLAGIGYCAHRAGLPVAEHYYKEALAQNPGSVVLNHDLGCFYLGKSDFTPARTHFERALALDERFAPARCQLALTLFAQFNLEQQRIRPAAVAAEAPMPDLLRSALDHLARGLPKVETAHAAQAAQIARVYAAAAPYDAAQKASALTWIEQALAAGSSPVQLKTDPAFVPLRDDPRFAAMCQRPAATPPSTAWIRVLDPIAD